MQILNIIGGVSLGLASLGPVLFGLALRLGWLPESLVAWLAQGGPF
jgi:hypothetical protein